MYEHVLAVHIAGALLTFGLVFASIVSLVKKTKNYTLHISGLCILSIFQSTSGLILFALSGSELLLFCKNIAIYSLIILSVQAVLFLNNKLKVSKLPLIAPHILSLASIFTAIIIT
jgi:hypothetical protein